MRYIDIITHTFFKSNYVFGSNMFDCFVGPLELSVIFKNNNYLTGLTEQQYRHLYSRKSAPCLGQFRAPVTSLHAPQISSAGSHQPLVSASHRARPPKYACHCNIQRYYHEIPIKIPITLKLSKKPGVIQCTYFAAAMTHVVGVSLHSVRRGVGQHATARSAG